MSSDNIERVVPLSEEDLTRIVADDSAATFHFDYAASVTLVRQANRRKWEEHDRPEDAGSVFFISQEDAWRVQHSRTGFVIGSNVRVIREGSAETSAVSRTGNEPSDGEVG